MTRIIFGIVFLVEMAALANRGGGPLAAHLVLTFAVFGALVLCLLKKARLRRPPGWPLLAYAVFFLFFTVSLIASRTPEYGLSELLLFANGGFLFFLIGSMEISSKDLRWFTVGVLTLVTADTLIGFFIYTRTPFPRFTGTFTNLAQSYAAFGNDYADFLLLTLPLALAAFFKKHQRISATVISGLAAVILFSGFVLSFSRAAWAGFLLTGLFAAGWLWFFSPGRTDFVSGKKVLLRLAAGALVTVFFIGALQAVRSQKFQAISFFHKAAFQADEGGASITERIDFWKGAAKIIADRPLFGSGVLSFKYLYPRYQPTFGANWDHPHNLFLKIGVENGIFAMVFFAAFLGAAGWAIARFLRKNPHHPVLFLALGSLGALAHNFIDFNFIVANFTLLMTFLGLGMAHARSGILQQVQDDRCPFLRPLFLCSFLLVFLGLHEGFYNFSFKRGRELLASGRTLEAVALLEKSGRLFFPRDRVLYLSAAYRKQYEQTHDSVWREKEKQMLQPVALASVDAAIPSRLGELYVQEKSYAKAEAFFSRALFLDPQNRLKYYYQWLDVQDAQGKRIAPSFRGDIVRLLAAYTELLRKNRHMTALTDNPEYAGRLYDFFGMPVERQRLNAIWAQELAKFAAKYGSVPQPFL